MRYLAVVLCLCCGSAFADDSSLAATSQLPAALQFMKVSPNQICSKTHASGVRGRAICANGMVANDVKGSFFNPGKVTIMTGFEKSVTLNTTRSFSAGQNVNVCFGKIAF